MWLSVWVAMQRLHSMPCLWDASAIIVPRCSPTTTGHCPASVAMLDFQFNLPSTQPDVSPLQLSAQELISKSTQYWTSALANLDFMTKTTPKLLKSHPLWTVWLGLAHLHWIKSHQVLMESANVILPTTTTTQPQPSPLWLAPSATQPIISLLTLLLKPANAVVPITLTNLQVHVSCAQLLLEPTQFKARILNQNVCATVVVQMPTMESAVSTVSYVPLLTKLPDLELVFAALFIDWTEEFVLFVEPTKSKIPTTNRTLHAFVNLTVDSNQAQWVQTWFAYFVTKALFKALPTQLNAFARLDSTWIQTQINVSAADSTNTLPWMAKNANVFPDSWTNLLWLVKLVY